MKWEAIGGKWISFTEMLNPRHVLGYVRFKCQFSCHVLLLDANGRFVCLKALLFGASQQIQKATREAANST